MKKLLLVLALLCAPIAAQAQCNGVFSAATVCGSIAGGPPGPVPFSSVGQLPGGTSGQTQYNNSGVFGGYTPSGDVTVNPSTGVETIQPNAVTNSKIASGATNTFKGSLNGTSTSDIALVACSAVYQITQWVTGTGWQCNNQYILPSRAIAASLNLSALSAIKTLGYATAGDGGGATFVNVASTRFIDQFFGGGYGSFTINAAGSGYTNGTFLGQPLTGLSTNCSGKITVSGGVVTAVVIIVPCVGFAANDILQAPNLAGGSGFQLKVNTVTTPLGSFSDTAGNHWQYIVDDGNFINTKQFGDKADWVAGYNPTGAGTDNTASIQAAWSFASYNADGHSPGNGGAAGATVIHPRGFSMFCDNANSSSSNTGLVLPLGVHAKGQGVFASGLVHCGAATGPGNGNVNPITLCDTVSALGQFGCRISDMTIMDPQTGAASTTAVIYSNSGQQQTLGDDLLILTASRGCVYYQLGQGGAANDIWHDIDCEITSASNINSGFRLDASSTQHILEHIVFGCPTSCSSIAINNLNGKLVANGIDIEGFPTGLNQAVSTAGNNGTYTNIQQNSNNCSQAIALTSVNTPGNMIFENITTGCPITILNGQAGGTNFTGNIRGPTMCVSGACNAAVP